MVYDTPQIDLEMRGLIQPTKKTNKPRLEETAQEAPSAGPFIEKRHRGGHITYHPAPKPKEGLIVGPYGELMLPGDTTYLP